VQVGWFRILKECLGAHDPDGINEIGCVYTARGFEFDYAGFIFGPDIVFDPKKADWRGFPERLFDTVVKRSRETFLRNVRTRIECFLVGASKVITSTSVIRRALGNAAPMKTPTGC
jgi:DUF2075 family protein